MVHADQHMGFDAVVEPVEHRAEVQAVGLDRPEVARAASQAIAA
jgi:hypothetical protein